MRLCGISSRFQLLSLLYRAGYPRVTHPSATQSPIDHPKNLKRCFVRLACVRHAASVHPEPGSNSQIKCFLFSHAANVWNLCISLLINKYFKHLTYALSLIETKDLSVVEMNAEQAHKNVCSGPEPLVLFLSLLLYLGFELRSVPWTFLQTSLSGKPEWNLN